MSQSFYNVVHYWAQWKHENYYEFAAPELENNMKDVGVSCCSYL